VKPRFIVCDESVAALDVSIQAQIINLFMELRAGARAHLPVHQPRPRRGEPHLDRVAIMYLGRIVESAPADEFFDIRTHLHAALLREVRPSRTGVPLLAHQGRDPSPLNRRAAATSTRAALRDGRLPSRGAALREIAPVTSALPLNDVRPRPSAQNPRTHLREDLP
jgi:peptide/nickel transport system ATP-binding protein